jgi:methionyl-tRNA formyltransferase
MRTAEDGLVDWSKPSEAIFNLVRALAAPWPGAFTSIGGTRLVLRRVEPADEVAVGPGLPGTVARVGDEKILVRTGSGAVALEAVEIDGRPASPAELERAGLTVGRQLA